MELLKLHKHLIINELEKYQEYFLAQKKRSFRFGFFIAYDIL
jgi:hypothetical protein